MSMNIKRPITYLGLLGLAALLSGCAGGGAAYRPIVDRPSANYERDLHDCQHLAEQRKYINSDTKTATAAGAAVGGVVAAVRTDDESFDDVATGAAIGAAIGGGGALLKTRQERKDIVMRCMSGRGYRVLG